jgi:Zn-dependent protease
MVRIAGVDISVHWSFSFVILWILLQSAFESRTLEHTLLTLGGTLLIFSCVLLHEVGHALMAVSLNLRVKNIVLLPFGGLAQIQSVPEKPLVEFLVATAGPLVNLIIVLLLAPALLFLGWPGLLDELAVRPLETTHYLLASFFHRQTLFGLILLTMAINFVLFVFNLIPALPMDGGRILRAGLSAAFPYSQATRITLITGYLIAIGLIVLAWRWYNFGLLFIAIFVLLASRPAR